MLRTRYHVAALLLFTAFQSIGQRLPSIEQDLLRKAVITFDAPDGASLPVELTQLLDNKSVVAVGEVTHSTAEVEQLQLAVAKALVRDHDFRVVALGELYISSTWLLNEYVLSGRGDAREALRAVYTQQYGRTSTEMLRFVEWLRTINASRPLDQRVRLMGTESGPPSQLARIAWMYSQEQQMVLPDSLQKTLAELLALPASYKPQPNLDRLRISTRALTNLLLRDNAAFPLTPKQNWQRQCIRQLPEALETFCRPTQAYRDRAIYENIRWLKERRPNTKTVVIAIHNAHIEKRPCYNWEGLTRAGYWLDSTYGGQFVAIGTEVGRGTYASGNEKETRVIRVPENRQKLGTLISSVTTSPYGFINLNELPDITQFFRAHNRLTYGTSNQQVGTTWPCATLPDAFDALLYSRESTPTQRSLVAGDSSDAPAFSLYVNMADSLKGQLQRAGRFQISLQADFNAMPDADCSVSLTVYCHDK